MDTLVVLQARMGSTRFPGKVLKKVSNLTLIEVLLRRLARSRRVDGIVLATSTNPNNAPLISTVSRLGYPVYTGSENDVLDRYYQAARQHRPDFVVRITGDCPLIDADVVDLVIDRFLEAGVDYATNSTPPTFPDGLNTEICSFAALQRAWREATKPYDREHVTPYLRDSGLFTWINVSNQEDWSSERWTVDEPEDFEVVRRVIERFSPRIDFSWREVIDLYKREPTLFEANRHLFRDEGGLLGTGQKLWKRAKRVIPGGSMLLSKRAEMYLPGGWPAYFSKARGCRVWDLDGREFIDMSFMGIGTNTLGYGDPDVDAAVRTTIDNGNMSTLNCPEEVYLAERLIELHPWARMVRFARSGGEADVIAIRLARAASGRDKVAFCGYHGWHDWYLAANLGDDANLTGHLLPGLEPRGVPQHLRGSVIPFGYNRFDELERATADPDVGVICMEVTRNEEPAPGFLERVRAIADARGIVLVFDECTSGFRQTFGGLHQAYGVEPDIAVFGKALGNGYAITAVVGRDEVMNEAQRSFISSTFWTERIGSSAALKTLDVMERTRSWERITAVGRDIAERWRALGTIHGLPVRTFGLPALVSFAIDSPNMLSYKTLITQEMLGRGFLATTSVYTSLAHTPDIVDRYFDALDSVFALIRTCEDGRPVADLLHGPVCHAGFRRLN